jgi:hypothetical protein
MWIRRVEMIIRQTPKNKDKYIVVNSDTSNVLHKHGFYPKYIDNEFIYYVKSKELIEFMSMEGL